MPDTRQHRGSHPEDPRLFGADALPLLRQALSDFCWLLNRGYAGPSSLTLVGNRYNLNECQRTALRRVACTDAERDARRSRLVSNISGRPVVVDGFNVLTTMEVALGGGVLLPARDGSLRDLGSIHGTYRTVVETPEALRLLQQALEPAQSCRWLLDSPVSNSGCLAARLREFGWEVELVPDPDRLLYAVRDPEVAVTADSAILDQGVPWTNLTYRIAPRRFWVDLL